MGSTPITATIFMKAYISKLRKKALQSECIYKIAALGFNKKGECVASSVNKPFINKRGGGLHAEEQLFKVATRKGIVKILICRVGRGGKLRPIEPCASCSKTAKKLGIRIISIKEN